MNETYILIYTIINLKLTNLWIRVLNNLLERDLNKNDNYLSTLFDCIVNYFETNNFRNNEKNNELKWL